MVYSIPSHLVQEDFNGLEPVGRGMAMGINDYHVLAPFFPAERFGLGNRPANQAWRPLDRMPGITSGIATSIPDLDTNLRGPQAHQCTPLQAPGKGRRETGGGCSEGARPTLQG